MIQWISGRLCSVAFRSRLGEIPVGLWRVRCRNGRLVALGTGALALMLSGLASALLLTSGVGSSSRSSVSRAGGFLSLPLAARGPMSTALGADDRAYRVIGLVARNPAQRLTAGFGPQGVSISSGSARFRTALAGFGRGGTVQGLPSVQPRVDGPNRVSYARGPVREWWANGPVGLEQGFDVARRPAGAGALTFSLSVSGRARVDRGGGAVEFVASSGRVVLRYTGLAAFDARGRALPAWFAGRPGGFVIRVDDRGGRYPVRIDPFVQQGAKLVGSPAAAFASEGSSVALADDGSTALVGAPGLNGSAGGAFVFIRSGSGWTQQGPALVGSGAAGTTGQGYEVALSGDGDTALVAGSGGAWVFSRTGSTWTQQGPELFGSDASNATTNVSVALSADGNTALVGESGLNNFVGASFVFTRSGSTWSQQGAPLVANCKSSCTGPNGTGEAGAGLFGAGVALSGDGNTALIGAPGDGGPFPNAIGPGATWVFNRSDAAWSQHGSKLVGTSALGPGSGQGAGVALSRDGSTALINGPNDSGGAGAAWVFTTSGSGWSQQTKLAGSDELYGNVAAEVALSDDGNTALLGGTDGAQLFTRSGSTWTRQQGLTGTGAVGSAEQGSSVALAGNGVTALIGGPFDDRGLGAAWVFVAGPSLTVALAGSGSGSVSGSGISCPGTCSEGLPAGSAVTLTATPAAGSTFAGWSGACTGGASCSLTVDADTVVTATFNKPPLCTLKVPSDKVLLAKPKPKHAHKSHASVGTLSVVVECDQATTVKLTGVLSELLGHKPKHGKRKTKTFTLRPMDGSLGADAKKALRLKLPHGALRGLRRKARESVALTLIAINADGTGRASANIARLRGVR